MKLVINTQYRENYGAHDWDGEGECPQYWKSKGGSEYVVEEIESTPIDSAIDSLRKLIEYSDDHSAEYIIDCQIVEDDDEPWEEWKTPWMLTLHEGDWYVNRNTHYDDVQKIETYIMRDGGEREDYKSRYSPLSKDEPEPCGCGDETHDH